MKKTPTMLLRAAIVLVGLVVLALCIFVLPIGIKEEGSSGFGPIFWVMYATAVPFFVALFYTLKLLGYVDKNLAFSDASVKALKYIKYSALIVSVLYGAVLPYFYLFAQQADAPGVMVIGLILAFAPLVIALFAAVLQNLLQNAIDIKSENDLTV